METTTLHAIDPTIDEYYDPLIKGQWQWKSNPNPWCKTEQPQWKSYSPEQNYRIEKAYDDDQKEANVGDYIIYPRDKLQKRKDNRDAQRPVRRVRQSDIEDNDRSERYYVTETPKTLNQVFGSLQDLMSFFSGRSNEICEFTNDFEKCQDSQDLDDLNEKILPVVVSCLQEELRSLDSSEIKNESMTSFHKKMKEKAQERNQELISMFERRFYSFREFYECILKAYTMNAFLYPNFNKCLRNEDWIGLTNLLPYAFCVCNAFFYFKESQSIDINLSGQNSKGLENISLYRGTALDELSLSHYDVKRQKYFSWQSVTSTTISQGVAKNFMYKSADPPKKKYPVMFILDIPIEKVESKYLLYLGVKLFSANPQEDEVILPPGSIFELQEVCKEDDDGVIVIKVQLKSDFKLLDYKGVVMHGAKQNAMIKDKRIKIRFSNEGKLLGDFNFLSGNLSIQNIEFEDCEFSQKSIERMISTLSSMKGIKKIQFKSCKFMNNKHLSTLENQSNYEISQSNNRVEELEIEFIHSKIFLGEVIDLVPSILTGRLDLTSLRLKLSECDNLTNNGVLNFCSEGLKHLIELRSLMINFSLCSALADNAIETLSQEGLIHLTHLKSLELNFTKCFQITDVGFSHLCQMLRKLPELKFLNISFWWDHQITLHSSKNFILNKEFKRLTLCFEPSKFYFDICGEIEDMCKNGLRYLTHLTSLHLDFSKTLDISNDGIRIFCIEGLNHLAALTSLNLDFSGCYKITDEGILNLGKIGINHLTMLTFLNLNFSECPKITDEGILNLLQGLNPFPTLASLNLNILAYSKITNEGVRNLCINGLNHLGTLKVLNLDFSGAFQITGQGIQNVCIEQFKHLTSLTCLHLNFTKCKGITNKIIRNIRSYGLKDLITLTSLSLDFYECENLGDRGILSLCLNGLNHLTALTSLSLNFARCKKITDKGVSGLWALIQLKLTTIKSLNLDFSGIDSITDVGVKFPSSIEHCKLFSLHLNLSNCENITDDGILNLCHNGLNYCTALTELSLDFSDSLFRLGTDNPHFEKRTGKGIYYLYSEWLNHLIDLTSLNLNFSGCSKVTDEEVLDLCSQGLNQLLALKSLNLNFSIPNDNVNESFPSKCVEALKNLSQLKPLKITWNKWCQEIKTEN